jgi:hypothetical protein
VNWEAFWVAILVGSPFLVYTTYKLIFGRKKK